MIKAILADCDGVIRDWQNIDTQVEQAFDLPLGAIHQAAFAPDILIPAIRGEIADDVWRQRIAQRLAERYPTKPIQQAMQMWQASVGHVNQAVLKLLQSYRPTCQLVLISNATSRFEQDLQALNLEHAFDLVINTSKFGVIKPEPAIFQATLDLIQAKPEEVVFIDDSLQHVESARSLGIRSHHFVDFAGLEAFLAHKVES